MLSIHLNRSSNPQISVRTFTVLGNYVFVYPCVMLMDGIMMKQTHVVKIPFPFLWPSPRTHPCLSKHAPTVSPTHSAKRIERKKAAQVLPLRRDSSDSEDGDDSTGGRKDGVRGPHRRFQFSGFERFFGGEVLERGSAKLRRIAQEQSCLTR